MDLKRAGEGFSLLELVVAIALSTVVLLAASSLLVSFLKFSSKTVDQEAELMGSVMGAYEEIVSKLMVANQVTIPDPAVVANPVGRSIAIRVDDAGLLPRTPTNFADDTIHTFWQDGALLKYRTTPANGTGTPGATIDLAKDIVSVDFVAEDINRVHISLSARSNDGPRETLETSVSMQARSAV